MTDAEKMVNKEMMTSAIRNIEEGFSLLNRAAIMLARVPGCRTESETISRSVASLNGEYEYLKRVRDRS